MNQGESTDEKGCGAFSSSELQMNPQDSDHLYFSSVKMNFDL